MRRSRRVVGWTGWLVGCVAAAAPALELALERTRGELLAVPVEVGGERMRWALDTGAGRSMITAALAAQWGLAPRARFDVVDTRGQVRTALAGGPLAVCLGEVEVRLELVGWLPGERLFFEEEGLSGLLAADLLAGVDLWVDDDDVRLRVAPAGGLVSAYGGARLPVELLEGRPAILLELAGLERRPVALRLVVDSGTDRTVLFGARAVQLAAARRGLAGSAALVAAHGASVVALAPLGRARAGEVTVRLGMAALLPATRDREEDGLVPLAALGPVLFELSAGRVTVGASPRAPPPGARTQR